MSTESIQEAVIYGLGEGAMVGDSTMLSYALRWANTAYNRIKMKPKVPVFDVRTIFRTTDGQQTYQMPADFIGFITLKDESANNIIEQVTAEEFARRAEVTKITDESWTSSSGVAVAVAQNAIVQFSETVTNTAGTTTYTKDTDYSIDYVDGEITMIGAGSLVDATEYYVDYLYYQTSKPAKFCLEYDGDNSRWVVRMEPTPDAEYIFSLFYPADPTALSDSADALWSKYEYAIERGGIYFGGMEITEDRQKRQEYKRDFDEAIADLLMLQQDLVPKRDRIRMALRRNDYYSRQTGTWDDA